MTPATTAAAVALVTHTVPAGQVTALAAALAAAAAVTAVVTVPVLAVVVAVAVAVAGWIPMEAAQDYATARVWGGCVWSV